MALTGAERQARLREKKAAQQTPVRYRRPVDRRGRPQRWSEAVATLDEILTWAEAWRGRMPESLAETATAERLDELLELRELVDQLKEAELPRGFGRD